MLRALNWISLGYAARRTTHNNKYIYIYKKSPFASLEGGSLTLAPTTYKIIACIERNGESIKQVKVRLAIHD